MSEVTQVPDLMPVMPEIILALGAMALLMIGVFGGRSITHLVFGLAMGLLAGTGLVMLFLPTLGVTFGGSFVADEFSYFMKLLVLTGSFFAIAMSWAYAKSQSFDKFEYPVLILLATLGMMLMLSANDMIALYLGLELQSLALYVVAAINRDSVRSTEAGLKYFVLGALSSGMLLYGMSLVYGFTGQVGFEEIAAMLAEEGASLGLVVGMVFILAGLAFKISAVPFHMWTPDVYEGAPTPVTAFFAAAPKFAAMALILRTLATSFTGDMVEEWRPVIALIAVFSMAVGAFSAIAQTNIKRLMAYSSIGHMGYALIGLSAGTAEGARAVLVYMAIYVIMTIGTFACILMMRRRGGMTENISDLSGLLKTNTPLAIVLTALMFSLAGVPPMAGFFGKYFVFLAAVDEGMIWLAVVGVVASAISAFYYLRIVWFIWFEEPAPAFERDAGPALGVAAWGSAILMFPVLTVFMGPFLQMAGRAAASLF